MYDSSLSAQRWDNGVPGARLETYFIKILFNKKSIDPI